MRKAIRFVTVVVAALAIGVPAVYAADPAGQAGAAPESGWTSTNRLNINTATVDQLAKVPGLDMVTAKAIIAYRDTHGPFESVEDLQFIEGIDQNTLNSLYQYLLAE